jgi:hypothetical protein
LPERYLNSQIAITDLQGKSIYKTSIDGYKSVLSLEGKLASGMYFLKVENALGTGLKKLVIK